MFFLVLIFLFIFIAPMMWLSYVFKKHDITLANMPFNALEFGNLILKEKGLSDVKIEKTLNVDHYDLTQKTVRVIEDRLNKKSLTALSIVCHEIGHAIQHQENYKPLEQRTTLVKNTQWISSLGSGIMFMGIPTIMALGSYSFIKICLLILLLSIIINALIHIITLEVELDASFKKALPIIKEKVPAEYHEACKSVLLAAALTYVIGVFKHFFSFRFIWMLLTRLR